MESLLGEEQVLSSLTSVTAQKCLNFWSYRWITPEYLQEYLEAIFLVVAMESLLCEAKVRTRLIRPLDRAQIFIVILETVFLLLAMESLLGEEKVLSC
jgi:TRAP-type mannitol/chloroaromatic compound transport system permease small subunit